MKALGKYLLISPCDIKEEVSKSGLLLTASESVNTRYKDAIVVEPGADVVDSIKVGTKISYDSVQGHNIKIDDVVYRVILERDVALLLD
jgi:co-chaperonin GroES (HSP10)